MMTHSQIIKLRTSQHTFLFKHFMKKCAAQNESKEQWTNNDKHRIYCIYIYILIFVIMIWSDSYSPPVFNDCDVKNKNKFFHRHKTSKTENCNQTLSIKHWETWENTETHGKSLQTCTYVQSCTHITINTQTHITDPLTTLHMPCYSHTTPREKHAMIYTWHKGFIWSYK